MPRSHKKRKTNPFIDEIAGVGDDSCEDEDEDELMGSDDGYVADEREYDDDQLIIPQRLQDDAERREAASAGLLSLMAAPPAAGPVDNLLDAEAEAREAQQIAARWDERAREKVKFTYESYGGGNVLNRTAFALTVHDNPMWRVRVRPGQETQVVFKLLQQRIDKENAGISDETFQVASAIFQPSIPGSIYVEAPSALHVRLACGSFHGTKEPIELVSLEDAVAVVTCGAGPRSLDAHSWVRVRRGLYTGDLAFVRSITDPVFDGDDDEGVFPSTIVTINLIPRKKKKRKTGLVAERIVFFDSRCHEPECKRIELDEDGKQQEDMWKFRRCIFRNGLLEVKVTMSSLNFKKVNPTREELIKWLESWDEDVVLAVKNALVASRSEKSASGLCLGDRVDVKQGWAQGRKGTVQSIEGDEVLVDDITSSSSPPVTIRITDMQKYFVVGDHVCVISGPEVGLNGWCVKVENGAVQVSEHGTYREFWAVPERLKLQLPVSLWKPPPQPLKYLPGFKPIEFSAPRRPTRLNLWKDMHVRITGTMGKIDADGFLCPVPFKGYEGYIKEVNEYWPKDPKEPDDPDDREEYRRKLPRPQNASLSHQQGHLCASGCPACLPLSVSVGVALSAQGGQLHRNVDISYIQPLDDILSPATWKWALKLHHEEDGFPIIMRRDLRKVKWPSDTVKGRWELGVIELLHCQQWRERSLFEAHCIKLKDAPDRDVLIAKRNKLDLRPFWRPAILIKYPSSPPEDIREGYTRTGTPLPEEDVSDREGAWNPRTPDIADSWGVEAPDWTTGCKTQTETFSVDETWLDDELRKLPLFLTLASGSRALNHDTENVRATLKSSAPGNVVDLRLLRTNRPHEVSNVHIRHLLPVHPSTEEVSVTSTAKQYVVFIQGPLKGEFRLLDKVDGDRVWVKSLDGRELSEYSKYDLVLSREVKSSKAKKKGKGKDKAKHK